MNLDQIIRQAERDIVEVLTENGLEKPEPEMRLHEWIPIVAVGLRRLSEEIIDLKGRTVQLRSTIDTLKEEIKKHKVNVYD